MTKVKKVLGMMMAALLCFALTPAAAFANAGEMEEQTPEPGTIKIDQAIPGSEYKVYQLLELKSHSGSNYVYKITNDRLKPAAEPDANGNLYMGLLGITDMNGLPYLQYITGTDLVEWNPAVAQNDDNKTDFAKKALVLVKDNDVPATATATAPAVEGGGKYSTVEFGPLPFGYYVIGSTAGVLCSLTTNDPHITVTEKNDVPVLEKTVQWDSQDPDSKYVSENSAEIGEIVNFRSTITCAPGTEGYKFTDTMSEGLSLNVGSIKVKVNGIEIDAATNYQLYTKTIPPTIGADGEVIDYGVLVPANGFIIQFENSFIKSHSGDKEAGVAPQNIDIEYSGIVNGNATVGWEATDGVPKANENTAQLDYNNTTLTSSTKTFTWKVDVLKFVMNNEVEEPLPNAVFSLYRDEACTNLVSLVAEPDNSGNFRVATDAESASAVDTFTSTNTQITINGLDADTYYLKETTAPEGYNALDNPVKIEITEIEKITGQDENGENIYAQNTINGYKVNGQDGIIKVENKTGSLLPSTGGMGTTILYIVGGILVIGAVVFLVRRRSNATK